MPGPTCASWDFKDHQITRRNIIVEHASTRLWSRAFVPSRPAPARRISDRVLMVIRSNHRTPIIRRASFFASRDTPLYTVANSSIRGRRQVASERKRHARHVLPVSRQTNGISEGAVYGVRARRTPRHGRRRRFGSLARDCIRSSARLSATSRP